MNQPIDRNVTTTLRLNPISKTASPIAFSTSGSLALPGYLYSVDLEIKVPNGLDDQSVSVQMFGPPNPPPPSEMCPCPSAMPSNGVCEFENATLIASLVNDPNVTWRGCVPSPYWDGAKGELMFSHCWRYSCLPDAFQKKDYYLDLDWTTKYNVADVRDGEHRLEWFKPKVVDMFLKFRYAVNPTAAVEFSSRDGDRYITVPPGGITQMAVRFKIPYNMKYDVNSGSVNLNTDPARSIPPPPPPLAETNFSRAVQRAGSILRSAIYINDYLGAANISTSAIQNFSTSIQGSLPTYISTTEIPFTDFSFVQVRAVSRSW